MARTIWLRAGGAVTALALLAGCFYTFAWLAQGEETTSFAYTGQVSRVVVNLNSGDLAISAGNEGGISGTQDLTWSLVHPQVHRTWDPARQTLTLDVGCQSTLGLTRRCWAAFTLSVPPGAAVRAVVGSGELDVDGVHGPLDLTAQPGDVSAHGTLGPVTARSTAGNVTIDGSSPSVTATTDAGNVTAMFDAPPTTVRAHTTAGNVAVGVPRTASYAVTASTDVGTRDVREVADDPAAARRITIDSTTGNVSVHYT